MEIYVGTIDMSFGNFSFQSKHNGVNKFKRKLVRTTLYSIFNFLSIILLLKRHACLLGFSSVLQSLDVTHCLKLKSSLVEGSLFYYI